MKKIFIIPVLLITLTFMGCTTEVDLNQNLSSQEVPDIPQEESLNISNFKGTKGDFIAINNDQIVIDVDEVDDETAHYFNTILPNGNPVYFFIIKSPDGNLRAAANGCQVCGDALEGFRQVGNYMVCNTCGNKYPLNRIATEKGGCNPAPIDPDLEIEDGQITISLSKLEDIEEFFQ